MAMLMLNVGDLQITVHPDGVEEAYAPEFAAVWDKLPDNHPLKVGDHRVTFYEIARPEDDTVCVARLGEADALEVVGLWLTLETERELKIENPSARARLIALMGKDIKRFLP